MNKLSHYAITITFLVAITIPLLFLHNRAESPLEKRKLAPLPDKAEDWQSWRMGREKLEAFYNDHFGFRDQLAFAYSLLNFQLGISPSEKVVIGKKGWLFFAGNNALDDYRGNRLFSEQQLKNWKKHLETKYYGLKALGIEYVFVVAPNKHSIYGEYLPGRIKKVGDVSYLDQLIAYMRSSEVSILDLRPALIAAKNKGFLYERTGTHWNPLGANDAQYQIAAYLQRKFPEVQPQQFMPNEYVWQPAKAKDLAKMIYLVDILKEDFPFLIKSKHPAFNITHLAGRKLFFMEAENAPPVQALIFRDSFFTQLKTYMPLYFSEALYVWQYASKFSLLEKHLADRKPDIVIEEVAERFLKSYQLSPPQPQDTLFYPVWQQFSSMK